MKKRKYMCNKISRSPKTSGTKPTIPKKPKPLTDLPPTINTTPTASALPPKYTKSKNIYASTLWAAHTGTFDKSDVKSSEVHRFSGRSNTTYVKYRKSKRSK